MSDAEIMAYVDGELDAAARAAFEARLREDAGLRERVERERRLRALLGAAYAPVMDEPVPARLAAALAPKVVSLDAERRRRMPSWAQLGGVAASVALGLLIGRQMPPGGTPLMQAQGELAQALDSQLSGTAGKVSVGLSFAAKGGGYCRSFVADGSAGLACREGAGWRLRHLMPAAPADKAEYRMAASATPPALLAAVDELREGEVLDARQEAAARDKGWRR